MKELSESKEVSACGILAKKHDQNNINFVMLLLGAVLIFSLTKNTRYIESSSNPAEPSEKIEIADENTAIKIPVKHVPRSEIVHPKKPGFDIFINPDQIIDKLTYITDIMRQISKLSNIKNTALSGGGSLEQIQKAFEIFKNMLPDNKRFDKLNNIDTIISNIRRFGDFKKIVELQSRLSPVLNKNSENSFDDILKIITPLVSDSNSSENLENMQKIMKMASLISSLNNSNDKI